ncbi:MAG: Protein of unknown function (DUF1587)/Protein of unknown function (DUF1592)/Protein of unknown [Verrucomicrobiales bacterium]|nr:Protein of unknown function (DUF1587)/Protein of unknown function (DUF1592)/Protein of unknown [Verrucomicrobiales bacterium]
MKFLCTNCQTVFRAELESGNPPSCPSCSSPDVVKAKSNAWFNFRVSILSLGLIVAAGFLLQSLTGIFTPPRKPIAKKSSSTNTVTLSYVHDVRPLLEEYCYSCHGEKKKKADLSLQAFADEDSVLANRKVWEKVLLNLRSGTMPPDGKTQPALAQREKVASWIENTLFKCNCDDPDPGRVTVRRLNRSEYNNTVHDLVGVDFKPADDFPADDTGYGFDTIGDVLSVPPVLLEKYFTAAESIMDKAIVTDPEKLKGTLPSTHQKIFFKPYNQDNKMQVAREIMERFASHAYRRPVTPSEVDKLLRFITVAEKEKQGFEQGIKLACEAVLVNSKFLFRMEFQQEPNNPDQTTNLDEFALASRLSYFLWSTMPDEELFLNAGRHRLRQNLDKQIARMLKDDKSRALVDNFGGQWLQLRNLALVTPDRKTFPTFDEPLRQAMRKETELFFQGIVQEDRNVNEIINADYSYLNERLAKHYGISGVDGKEFKKVSLPPGQRMGLLTHASILTITSNPNRTSPVKRGKYVLENILGTPPPPPPPDVPALSEKELTGTLRQRMEAHRDNPVCASCHARMDPIGFGFEHFDGIGAWREKDGTNSIDPAGKLVSGETFTNHVELSRLLAGKKKDEFVRCFTEKLFTYATGRGPEYYDKCAFELMTKAISTNNYRFSAVVAQIVESIPFQKRRGEGERTLVQSSQ